MKEHLIRSIVTIIVSFVTEGNSLMSTHKEIFIKMVASKKKVHDYQNIFIVYLEPVLKVRNEVIEI